MDAIAYSEGNDGRNINFVTSMRLTKTISAISIIVLVLLPCIYCIYFQAKNYVIRLEMEEKLESEQLQTVIVPVKQFYWYEDGREIIVDGIMFDVRSIEQQGDNYVITGLYDEEETAMHIAMGKLQKQKGNGPNPELICIMVLHTLMPPIALNIIQLPQSNDLASHMIYPDESLYNTILSIHTPPPRS